MILQRLEESPYSTSGDITHDVTNKKYRT